MAPASGVQTSDEALPRILCLHGGGVNGDVFRFQCRAIINRLKHHYRLVFLDAPFPSAPHDAIVPFFGSLGPFYRWLRWQPEHADMDARDTAAMITERCNEAINSDSGTGEWVGLLGFSQGAKIAASWLWSQERKACMIDLPVDLPEFKFGILMAGSAPIVMLDTRTTSAPKHIETADQLSMSFEDWPKDNQGEHALGIPTLHVHGLQDPGVWRHKILLERYCRAGSTRLVEWDGGHRLPIKPADVEAITDKIIEMGKEAGVE